MCYPSTCQKHSTQPQKKYVETLQDYLADDETQMLSYGFNIA